MAQNKMTMGTLLFSIAAIIAVVMGLGAAMEWSWISQPWLIVVLIAIGLIVGFRNITTKEVSSFLIGTVSLILATAVANLIAINTLIPKVGTFIQASLSNFMIWF